MADYGQRVSRAVGLNDKAFGGAGLNLPLECISGEGDMIAVFDDFNDVLPAVGFSDALGATSTNVWEDNGWVMTEDAGVTAVGDTISMNDPVVGTNISDFDSCIRIFPGTADDSGGNMQLDLINTPALTDTDCGSSNDVSLLKRPFPHLWIPETATIPAAGGIAGEAWDNTTWVLACRIGLKADATAATAVTGWAGKAVIGWAAAGDTTIMDHTGGAMTTAEGNLHGFHIPEDGSIDAISKRASGDAFTSGTNFTELIAAGGVDGTVANGARSAADTMWFDLALRMDITNMSDNDANGATRFYYRGPLNRNSGPESGRDVWDQPGQGYQPWIAHSTVLTNQTPNHTIALVPTIEVLNSDDTGEDCLFFLDWWTFGRNRLSR